MARYTGADCRLCRREGIKLFLKGDRCYTDKCAVERRPYPPGQAGQEARRATRSTASSCARSRRPSASTACSRSSSAATTRLASRQTGITGENLLRILESRLDNVVYRLGFAQVRDEARQIVRHGHITVNGRARRHPVAIGCVRATSSPWPRSPRTCSSSRRRSSSSEKIEVPGWLEVDIEKLQGKVLSLPTRDQIDAPVREQLIVELYSK